MNYNTQLVGNRIQKNQAQNRYGDKFRNENSHTVILTNVKVYK